MGLSIICRFLLLKLRFVFFRVSSPCVTVIHRDSPSFTVRHFDFSLGCAGMRRDAPGMRPGCARDAPGMRPGCARDAPGMRPGCARDAPLSLHLTQIGQGTKVLRGLIMAQNCNVPFAVGACRVPPTSSPHTRIAASLCVFCA